MATVPRQHISHAKIAEHVQRLGEHYPPIPLDSVDRTIKNPALVAQRFGNVIDYLARVELEVDRSVLELLALLPDVDDINKTFYADVWQPQEIQHGLILDRIQQDLGRPPADPHLAVSFKIKVLGALARFKPIQDIAKLLYYLTGASTERQAVLAYNRINAGLKEMGEKAITQTIITPIKQQEPGHFAFYQMSGHRDDPGQSVEALAALRDSGVQGEDVRTGRHERDEGIQGRHGRCRRRPGLDEDLAGYAREVGRVERRLLWADRQGMEFPPYILKALRESVELYRERVSRPRDPARLIRLAAAPQQSGKVDESNPDR